MKHFILPIALGLALVSCNRDNDNNVEETPILPVKISGDEDGSLELKYNGDKLTEIITKDEGAEARNVVTYTGDFITSVVEYKGNIQTGEATHYTYNTQGKLVEVKQTSVENGETNTQTKTYQYNNDGTITETRIDGANMTPVLHTYTILNGNIVKKADEYGETIYKYDTKNNPFKNVKGMSALVLDNGAFGNANNIEEQISTYNFFGNSSTNKTTYTYDYNANNFPTKQVMKYGNDTETTTYTYNK